MKHKAQELILSFALVVTTSGATVLFPQSPLSLSLRADLVVVGTFSGINQQNGVTALSLNVARVLKGLPNLSCTIISVRSPLVQSTATGSASLPVVGSSGMWFLQKSSSDWTLLPVVQGPAPISLAYYPLPGGPPQDPYNYDPSASVSDKVAAELCSALESFGGANFGQLDGLHYALIDDLASPYTTMLFTRLSNSASVSSKILGLSGLIRQSNSVALASAVQLANTAAAYINENGILLFSVKNYFRGSDGVSVLGRAAMDRTLPARFREAVAHALAAIHDAGSLPFLAALLSDPDMNLRVEGIGGMGSFANGPPVQTPSNVASLGFLRFPATSPYLTAETKANFALGVPAIQQNETAYLAHWSQWWSKNRVALGF